MNKPSHSPTPWTVWVGNSDVYAGPIAENTESMIRGEKHQPFFCVARCDDDDAIDKSEQAANADLIVRAVNSHDALVQACKAAVDEADKAVNPSARLPNYRQMRAALKLAGADA